MNPAALLHVFFQILQPLGHLRVCDRAAGSQEAQRSQRGGTDSDLRTHRTIPRLLCRQELDRTVNRPSGRPAGQARKPCLRLRTDFHGEAERQPAIVTTIRGNVRIISSPLLHIFRAQCYRGLSKRKTLGADCRLRLSTHQYAIFVPDVAKKKRIVVTTDFFRRYVFRRDQQHRSSCLIQ